MLRVIGIVTLGILLLGQSRKAGQSLPRSAPPEVGESLEPDRRDRGELDFLVQIAERAGDRVLNDIRAFNAVAYALLGPVLAIVTFIDYKDVWNFAVLPFALVAVRFSFRIVLSGDGYPSPRLSERFVRAFENDPEQARRIVLLDLRTLAPVHDRLYRQKRQDLEVAARATLVAVLAAVGVKSVESLGAFTNVKEHTTRPAICSAGCSDRPNLAWLLWRVEPRAGVRRSDVIRLRPCNWTRPDEAGLDRTSAAFAKEVLVQAPLNVAISGSAFRPAFPVLDVDSARAGLPGC